MTDTSPLNFPMPRDRELEVTLRRPNRQRRQERRWPRRYKVAVSLWVVALFTWCGWYSHRVDQQADRIVRDCAVQVVC